VVLTYYLVTLPSKGTLYQNVGGVASGAPLVAGVALTSNQLMYRLTTSEYGNPLTTFTFRVRDGGSLDSTPATITIGLTYVNQPPITVFTNPVSIKDGGGCADHSGWH
jgi:hypothetical protein